MAHRLARVFAVAIVDFLVMQNTMMGLFRECFAIISGNLPKVSSSLPNYWGIHSLLWITDFFEAKVISAVRYPVHKFLQLDWPKFLSELIMLRW